MSLMSLGRGVPLDQYYDALSSDKAHSIKAVLVCRNETATGVTSDVPGVRRILDDWDTRRCFCRRGEFRGSLDFGWMNGVLSVIVSGSQKGFMLPTGLCIVGVSSKALANYSGSVCRRVISIFTVKKMNKMVIFHIRRR